MKRSPAVSFLTQLMKELEQVPTKELPALRKEIALLISIQRSTPDTTEQKTISSNVAAYLATK